MASKAKQAAAGNYDVAIIGAGLVGLAAAIALHAEGKRVALVDASNRRTILNAAWDTRIYALTPATEAWLRELAVWPLVDTERVNSVEAMALWRDGQPAASAPLMLQAEDAHIKQLACIIENQNLMHALWQKIAAIDVSVLSGAACEDLSYSENAIIVTLAGGEQVSASLVLAADGAHSFVRQQAGVSTKNKSFKQKALVANYLAEKAHGNIARQWFASHNTLALLPLPKQQVSMVWSVSTEMADALLNLTAAQLAERVQEQSQSMLGQLTPVSNTPSFELKQITADTMIADRVVLIGDAAHQVHPMAGQGANLGFRDVMALQAIMASSHRFQDIGETTFLRRFERNRKADVLSMNTLTSGLDYLFAQDQQLIKHTTSWGMQQLNKHSILKNILIKEAVS